MTLLGATRTPRLPGRKTPEQAELGEKQGDWGKDLVGGIDHGPGSNQLVHHPRMAAIRRSEESSLSALQCEARQEVKRESLCCLCQPCEDTGGLGWGRFTITDMPLCERWSPTQITCIH